MGKKYNPLESEKKWQDFWLENNVYTFDISSDKPIFSVDTPPTTVSGDIHMGHTFSYTQAEVITRYKRMNGYNIFYPFCTDTNGLATERLVEKKLGKKSSEMDKKEFTQHAIDITKEYSDKFKSFWQSLGYSNQWDQTYTTIQPEVQALAQKRFIEMIQKGQIFKKKFPALWSTTFQTSIAQAEVENKTFKSVFYDLKFTLNNGDTLKIATTRPELLPACVAVFVNPEDQRYKDIVGGTVTTPLDIQVPILADDKVQMDKGTGAVMCCTYGDETDMFWVQKHNLPERIIIDQYGKIRESGLDELEGLKVKEARKKIIEILKTKGAVLKEQDIEHDVGTHERDGSPVEIIPVNQRFVSVLSIKEQIIEQGAKMSWKPEYMYKRFKDWAENLHWDRCISRNRPFGIPIPVWTSKKTGEIILPDLEKDKFPLDPTTTLPNALPHGHTADDIQAETDVLDTWFISGLTPDINYMMLQKKGYQKDKSSFLPMSMRPHGHDIIRTWTFYTTIQSRLAYGQIPFENVMVSGFVLAKKGEKISKSKGNAKFSPEDMVKQYGADATRYWACAGQHGKDILFEENELKNGKKLVTKLWNAFQFVKMQLTDAEIKDLINFDRSELLATDKRILSQLQKTIISMRKYLDDYEYGLAKIRFEEFFWSDFCDTYLEMIKKRTYKPELFQDGELKKKAAQWTLFHVYYDIIRLIAPFLPHITEEIYQDYYKDYYKHTSIHIASYPEEEIHFGNEDDIDSEFIHIKEIVEAVRRFKTEQQISLGSELSQLTIQGDKDYLNIVEKYIDDIKGVTNSVVIELIPGEKSLICKYDK